MSKFKVGDKVRILDGSKINYYFGSWADGMKKYIGSICTIDDVHSDVHSDFYGATGYNMKEIDYIWDERGLERIEDKLKNQKIVITHDGKMTTAKLYDGKQVIKTAKAKCSPSDEFDFNVGASIAFARLTDKILGKVENTLFDWDGFKAGNFNVIVNCDTIDRFLEECEAHEINWGLRKATEFNPIKCFDKQSSFVRAMFQEIMGFDSTNECELKVVEGDLMYSFKPEIKESTVIYD